jgi:hypothetical protein
MSRQAAVLAFNRVVAAEEPIRGLGDTVDGQQRVHDDPSHAPHIRLVSMLLR